MIRPASARFRIVLRPQPARWIRQAWIATLPFAFLLAAGGCSTLGLSHSRSPEVPVHPTLAPYDTVGQNGDITAPDTTKAALVMPPLADSASVRAPTRPIAPPPVAARADSALVGTPPPAISIDLPPAEREELWTACLGDLGVADSILATSRADEGATDESRIAAREKEETVRGFVTQARSALDRDDLEAAANLARKARLLAEELTTR